MEPSSPGTLIWLLEVSFNAAAEKALKRATPNRSTIPERTFPIERTLTRKVVLDPTSPKEVLREPKTVGF
jgi:hypothetical protein